MVKTRGKFKPTLSRRLNLTIKLHSRQQLKTSKDVRKGYLSKDGYNPELSKWNGERFVRSNERK